MTLLLSCFDFDLFQIIPEAISATSWPRDWEVTLFCFFVSPAGSAGSDTKGAQRSRAGLKHMEWAYCVNVWIGTIVQESWICTHVRTKGENQNRRDQMNRKGANCLSGQTLRWTRFIQVWKAVAQLWIIIWNHMETSVRVFEDHGDIILLLEGIDAVCSIVDPLNVC